MAEFRNSDPLDADTNRSELPLAVMVPPEPSRMNPKVLGLMAIIAVVGIGLLSVGYVARYDANSPSSGPTVAAVAPSAPTATPSQAPTPAQTTGAAPNNPNSPGTAGMATTTGAGSASKPSPGAVTPEGATPAPANQGPQAPAPQ